ncbi:GLPGLI family protein, partial [Saprospiraceae bacterium]|nr:GLPGLI family protein [Saprospiraceae bacterium]
VAWFAPAIPCKIGPSHYGQLPGAILMLSVGEDKDVYKATEVILSDEVTIKKPKKGKKVTEEEYEKIIEDKMKEMHQSMGKNTLIIRG